MRWFKNSINSLDCKPQEGRSVIIWLKTENDWSVSQWRKSGWPQEIHWVDEFGGHFAEDDEVTHWAYVEGPTQSRIEQTEGKE